MHDKAEEEPNIAVDKYHHDVFTMVVNEKILLASMPNILTKTKQRSTSFYI